MIQLGNHLGEYGLNPAEIVRRAIFALLAVAMALFTGTYIIGEWFPGVLANPGRLISTPINLIYPCGALLLVFSGLWAVAMFVEALVIITQNPKLAIYENGVVLTRSDGVQIWRWDDFTKWKGRITEFKMYGALSMVTSGSCDFYSGDKIALKISGLYRRAGEAAELIMAQATSILLPRFVKRFKQGETLDFGEIKLSQGGLQAGKILIPLDDILALNNDQIHLYIGRHSQKKPSQVTLESITNLSMLLQLLPTIYTL